MTGAAGKPMTRKKGVSLGWWKKVPVWYRKVQSFILSLLKDESGSNAVEYALVMTLVGIFIVAGVISMAPELAEFFNSVANCAAEPVNCAPSLF